MMKKERDCFKKEKEGSKDQKPRWDSTLYLFGDREVG